jgi:SAM-dependent methyltransferase
MERCLRKPEMLARMYLLRSAQIIGVFAGRPGSRAAAKRSCRYHAPMQRPPFSALASVYDAIMADIEYGDWADFILDYARDAGLKPALPPCLNCLDLACGTGALTAELHARGLSVTGLDFSAEMLAVARQRLLGVSAGISPEMNTTPEMNLQMDFVQANLRDFDLPERFDLLTCVFDSLNNLTSPADLARSLERMALHLNPGGLLAFDVNTRAGVRDLWEGEVMEGLAPMPGGREVHYHWSHHYDPDTQLGTVQAICRVEGEEFIELHTERGYDAADLAPMLEAAGFASWEFCEYPDYAQPCPESPRIWVFARAKAAQAQAAQGQA